MFLKTKEYSERPPVEQLYPPNNLDFQKLYRRKSCYHLKTILVNCRGSGAYLITLPYVIFIRHVMIYTQYIRLCHTTLNELPALQAEAH